MVATANGARFLRQDDRIGTLAAGKRAGIAVVRGDPSIRIEDINVELVPGRHWLRTRNPDAVKGQVGIR